MNKRAIGSLYEEQVAAYLVSQGFQIIRQNYRCKVGEIDMIAERDGILRFIEVKYRSDDRYGAPVYAVTKKKQEKIYKTAQWFLKEQRMSEETPCSFDVISVIGNHIEYLENCYGNM